MTERTQRWLKRYEMIGTSCGKTKCVPCTYPYCQRYVREKKAAKSAFLAC